MLWLVPAVLACLAAGLFFSHRRGEAAVVLAAAAFAFAFLLGRGIESGWDRAWQQLAARLQGTFRAERPCSDLDRFGVPAPWHGWARDGELRCVRSVEAEADGVPYALVQVRYSVREPRGEEHPDTWYEVSVAALRRPGDAAAGALVPVVAAPGFAAMQNGRSVFVWKKGTPGAGASLEAAQLPTLLAEARRLAGR